MKILILSPHYHPYIHPRAHRWTCISEQWAKEGHDVYVICSKSRNLPLRQVVNHVNILRTGFNSLQEVFYFFSKNEIKRGVAGQKRAHAGKKGILFQWINDKILKNLYFPDSAFLWYKPAKKKAEQLIQNNHFDLMVSSSVPFTTHLIALKLKSIYPHLKWIADTGDPFAFQPLHPLNNYFLYGKINRRLEKKVVENADFVAVTNKGAVNLYQEFFPAERKKIKVIPPLFKFEESTPQIHTGSDVQLSIKIGYFGSFFKNIREPRKMLQFWVYFLEEYSDYKTRLELHFYGNIFENFLLDFAAFPSLKKHIFIHGMLTKAAAAAEMQCMDFLLNVGNATTFQLPSKCVDYLASGKAIINFSSIRDDTFYEFIKGRSRIINLTGTKKEINKLFFFLESKDNRVAQKKRDMKDFSPERIAKTYLDLVREIED
jgi:hypothetical protein